MAAVLISQSRWAEALETADRLMKIPDGAVIGHTLAGVVHHNTGESEQAVVEFDRVLELDPALERMPLKPRSMFWAEFGMNLLAIGRVDEAQRHLAPRRSARAMTPRSPTCSASPTISKGSSTTPSDAGGSHCGGTKTASTAGCGSASSQLQRGRPAEAIEPLRRAAAIEPDAVGPMYSLSLAYRRLGRTKCR